MQQQQTERWTQQMQQMYDRAAGWLKGFWQTLCTLWQDPHKRVRLMVAAGFAGMGLILCSRLCQPPKDEGKPMAAAPNNRNRAGSFARAAACRKSGSDARAAGGCGRM